MKETKEEKLKKLYKEYNLLLEMKKATEVKLEHIKRKLYDVSEEIYRERGYRGTIN